METEQTKLYEWMEPNPYPYSQNELEAMDKLKSLMALESKTIYFQTDENFLTKFLRAHDWNVEKALAGIKLVYRLKKKYPDWFAFKPVVDYMAFLKEQHRFLIKNRDQKGRRIFVFDLSKVMANTEVPELAQIDDLFFETLLNEHETQLNGIVVLIDCINIPIYCLKWTKIHNLKVGSAKSDALAVKSIECHLINTSNIAYSIINLLKPFLSKRVKTWFHFHQSDMTTLHKYINPDILPERFGGPKGVEPDYDYTFKYLLERDEFLCSNRKYGIIE